MICSGMLCLLCADMQQSSPTGRCVDCRQYSRTVGRSEINRAAWRAARALCRSRGRRVSVGTQAQASANHLLRTMGVSERHQHQLMSATAAALSGGAEVLKV
jgi:hypothetical protein